MRMSDGPLVSALGPGRGLSRRDKAPAALRQTGKARKLCRVLSTLGEKESERSSCSEPETPSPSRDSTTRKSLDSLDLEQFKTQVGPGPTGNARPGPGPCAGPRDPVTLPPGRRVGTSKFWF